MVTHRKRKMSWCTILHETHVLARSGHYSMQQLWEKCTICIRAGFFNLPWHPKSPQSFCQSPRLIHRPPDGYYYRDFHRLHVDCNPTFYHDLSSSYCLLQRFSKCAERQPRGHDNSTRRGRAY
ncbi:hypothetical protein TNCV_4221101 [Trichonephila clavipes]|nr:hypothetical protein TNCV_4221101 [Trichonephila clavipes]